MSRWVLILAVTLAGCTTTPDPLTPEDITGTVRGIYVLNEGLWGQANASLSLYNPQSQMVQLNVFAVANGRPLGDVGNFIVISGDEAFIVMNGSDRIEIIDVNTQKSQGTITLPPGLSPRQMVVVNDSLALVTNLYDASVSVCNLRTRTEVTRIPVGQNPEGIAVAAGLAFVANSGLGTGRSVTMIDLSVLNTVGDLDVADNPSDVLVLDSSRVMVLCAGSYGDFADPNDDSPATLVSIDALQRRVVDSIVIGGHAFRMASDGRGEIYIAGSGGVVSVDPRVPGSLRAFAAGDYNGVGVDPATGDVYLADARTFTVPGEIRVFDGAGTPKARFDAELIPGRFAFLRE